MKKTIVFLIIFLVSLFVYASWYIGAKSENTWEGTPGWSADWRGHDVCGNWYSTMGNYSGVVKKSWTTLRGTAKSRYEESGDGNTTYGLDGMDIFLHCGHSGLILDGGVQHARWNMWETDTYVYSSDMRLGDEARELKLFSTYGCYQMNNTDGQRWSDRWGQIFRGGLKYATGFHEYAWLFGSDHAKNRQLGIDYANYLNVTSKSIKYAWWDAVKAHASNKPAIGVTGSNVTDVVARRDYMKMSNIHSYPTLRDGSIGAYAWSTWR